jgi:hypothetical protein
MLQQRLINNPPATDAPSTTASKNKKK